MDESEIDFQDTRDRDSIDDELESILRAQDEDSENRLPNGEAVFEKFLGTSRMRSDI